MKDLLEFILDSILESTESVNIEEIEESPDTTVYTITSDDELKGAIIGKKGRTIQSIRNIIGVKAAKEGKRVYVKVE